MEQTSEFLYTKKANGMKALFLSLLGLLLSGVVLGLTLIFSYQIPFVLYSSLLKSSINVDIPSNEVRIASSS